MKVDVRFSVTSVTAIGAVIMLALRRVQEAKGAVPTSQILGRTEEERIAQRMTQATLSVMKQEIGKASAPWQAPRLPLSWEEYEKLGKPTVNDLLTITLTYQDSPKVAYPAPEESKEEAT